MADEEGPEGFDTATRGHHPDSPSSLQASEACASFVNEQRESQASKDGVLQHKATETRDLSILGGDEDMEAAVQRAIDYEEAVIDTFKLSRKPFQVVREKYLSVGTDIVPVVKPWTPAGEDELVWNPPAVGAPLREFVDFFRGVTGGFPDLEIVAEKHAEIVDQKFGRVPVVATKDNLQAIAYVLGRFEKSPTVETITFHFFAAYQRWDRETQRLKYTYTFRRDEIPKLELRVRTVVARKKLAQTLVKQDDWSMATPKHDLCIWCALKGTCKKVGALVIQAHEKYADLTVPDEIKYYRLTRPEQLAWAYRFASQMEPVLKAMKARVVELSLLDDLKPDGFTIVKSAFRNVKNVGAFLKVAESHGIPLDKATEMLSVPLGSFEEAIKEAAPPRKGAARIRAFKEELAECGATEMGKPFYFLREAKTPAEKEAPAIDV